jgi:hypothetical protein
LSPRLGTKQQQQPHAADVGDAADWFMKDTAYANSKLAQVNRIKNMTKK